MTSAHATSRQIRDALSLRDVHAPEPLWLDPATDGRPPTLSDTEYLAVGAHGLPRRVHILGEYEFTRVVCSSRAMRWVGDRDHNDFQFTAQAHLGLAYVAAGNVFSFVSHCNGLVDDHYTGSLDDAVEQANAWLERFAVVDDGQPWRWEDPSGPERLDRRLFDTFFRVLAGPQTP